VKIDVFPDAHVVATQGAAFIATCARAAVKQRNQFTLATSGGQTPWEMFRALADEEVPWDRIQVYQVDERIVPAGDPNRNLTQMKENLLSHTPLRPEQIHAMPIDQRNLNTALRQYAASLEKYTGKPPILDLIHLGLGTDGHTASLMPGDPVTEVTDHDVGLTGVHHGRQRMTLTYPILNRARQILWLVTGTAKSIMLARLRSGDTTIPAGRINSDRALVIADEDAAQAIRG
jgi:6-phosphogluconolactonase